MKLLNTEVLGQDCFSSKQSLGLAEVMDSVLSSDKKLSQIIRRAGAGDDLLFPTGFDLLDYRNGKKLDFYVRKTGEKKSFDVVGVPGGSMIMITGNTNVGKSTIANQISYAITESYPASATHLFDIEKGFSDERFMQINNISVDTCKQKFRRYVGKISTDALLKMLAKYAEKVEENRDLYEVDTGMDDQFGRPVKFIQPSVFIVDSVKTLSGSTAKEDEIEGSMTGGRIAKEITQFVVKAQPIIASANIILIFINHINSAMTTGTPKPAETIYGLKQDESLSGGKAIKYLCSTIWRFDTSSSLKVTEDKTYQFDGHFTIAKTIKTRSNKAGKEVKLAFVQGTGFHDGLSKFEFLIDKGVVTGTLRRTLPGYPKSVWLKEVKDLWDNDPEFRKAVNVASQPYLEEMLSKFDHKEENMSEDELKEEQEALAEIDEIMKDKE